MQAEAKVLSFLVEQNRPFNVQVVTDHLAQYGIKKAQVQRALDALFEQKKVICKEFGKTKLYMPPQDDKASVSSEDMEKLQQEVNTLSTRLQEEQVAVQRLQSELQRLQCSMTMEQIEDKTTELACQVGEAQAHLAKLKGSGAKLVTVTERAGVERALAANLDHWARWRRMFRSIWDQVSENMDDNVKELWEVIGVETDEAADVDLAAYQRLLPKKPRHR